MRTGWANERNSSALMAYSGAVASDSGMGTS
jgi:hypothetical protein